MKKKVNKELIVIFIVLAILIGLLVAILVNTIKNKNKCYEYYLNGKFGRSNNCYSEKQIGYCEIDGQKTKVEVYYEA